MTALVNPYWFAAAAATDPNFANVVLLLHFDGAHGDDGSDMIDSSLSGHTMGGSMTLTTAQQKFGTASVDARTGVNLSSADHADWDFGAGQFTVECWVRRTAAVPGSGHSAFVAQWINVASNLGWILRMSATDLQFCYSTTGTNTVVVTGTYSPALNTWVHLAADRDASNVLRIYADGVVIASASAAATFFNCTRTLVVGNEGSGSRYFTGQIDDLRITKGVARYAGAFTPPSAAFPDS